MVDTVAPSPPRRSSTTPADSEHPLSPLQAGMLYQALLDDHEAGGSDGYDIEQMHMALRAPDDGRFDVDAFVRAWHLALDRHDVLRMRFLWEGRDRPAQVASERVAVPFDVIDAKGWTDAQLEERLHRYLVEDRRRGFDLRQPPLMRLAIFVRGERGTDVVWSFHHILLDGRSFSLVLRDVFAAYEALRRGRPADLGPAPVPYGAFLDWVGARDPSSSRPYWKALLAGKRGATPAPLAEPPQLPLPVAPGAARYGETARFVDPATTAALRELVEQSRTTLGTVMHAAWAILLMRTTGDDDVVFGSTRACRRSAFEHGEREGAPTGADADGMVGLFINTVPVRVHLDDEARTLDDILQAMRHLNVELRAHEHTPLVDIQGQSDVPRGQPLFESLLMFETRELNKTLASMSRELFAQRTMTLHEQPSLPLSATIFDGERLELRLLFDRHRFKDEVIDRLLRGLEALLQKMARGKDQPLAALDTLSDDDVRRIVFDWNHTTRAFADRQLIHELFEARVDDQPNAIALEQGERRLTFAEVEARANQLAHLLRQRGAGRCKGFDDVEPGSYVGLCLERSPELVVTLLAIAKCGAAYLPLDPEYPTDRLAFMLEDARAQVVITQKKLRDRLPAEGIDVILLDDDDDRAAVDAQPTTRPSRVGEPTDVCYTIFTSGSTGKPKGVVLSHRAVVNTLDWVNRSFGVRRGDKVLFVTSVCFDLSVYDTFGVLGAGGTVLIASAQELKEPEALVRHLVSSGVTIWDSAPQALVRLVPFFPTTPATSSALRLVMLSGDWIPLSLPDAVKHAFPRVEQKSLGGATEAAIWSNWYPVERMDPRWKSVPYGWPIQNSNYHVLDRRMRPTPQGVPGDLYIGGACLAEGYLHRVELTAERFVPDPWRPGRRLYKTGDLARYHDDDARDAQPTGALGAPPAPPLEFLGRADFQVKVRGFRVELGEIEAAIQKHASVRDVVCVARADKSGEKSVVAYCTPPTGKEPSDIDPAAIKRFVASSLPDFMVPAHVVPLAALPVSSNGKLDRKALPDPAAAFGKKDVVPPKTPFQRDLLGVWEEVLRRSPISMDDNFFDLGGHSLLAALLVSKAKAKLGIDVPLSRVIKFPTPALLADAIEAERAPHGVHKPTSRLVTLQQGSADRPPLLFVAGIGGHVFTFQTLAKKLGAQQPVYAFQAIGADGEEAPRQSVAEIAAEYENEIVAMKLRGPLVVGGYSFGALVAFELARRMRARGEVPGCVVIFDAYAPGYPKKLPATKRALIHVENLLERDMKGRVDYLAQRLDNVRRRVLFKVGLGKTLAPAAVDGADAAREEQMKELWAVLTQAQAGYAPSGTDAGPALLFSAEKQWDWPATILDDATHGWRSWVTGPIRVETVKGAHLELFSDENVETIARVLTGIVDDVKRNGVARLA